MGKLAYLLAGLALIAVLKYGPGKIDSYCTGRGFYLDLLGGRAGILTPGDGPFDDILCQCNHGLDSSTR